MTADAGYARAVAGPISVLGGAFMISLQAKEFAKSSGLRSRPAYALGRFSVLGRVDPQVVVSAAGFWDPDEIGGAWATALESGEPADAVVPYLEAARGWGRERFESMQGIDELAALVWRVVDHLDITGAPLAAGWRAVPRRGGDHPRADALHGLFVLREFRAARHLAAVHSCGLTPLQAVLAGVGGEANAAFFGWSPPFPDVGELSVQRDEVEARTDHMLVPSFAALDPADGARLRELLTEAVAVATG